MVSGFYLTSTGLRMLNRVRDLTGTDVFWSISSTHNEIDVDTKDTEGGE